MEQSGARGAYELFQQIRQSEGERIFWKMEDLRAIYFVFLGNHVELIRNIEHFEAEQRRYLAVEKRPELREFQLENLRLLHNFLASAATLIDHTRVVVRELYSKHAFLEEYGQKIKDDFTTSDVAGFVKYLRNWMLHKGILPVAVQAIYDPGAGELKSSIVLIVDELKLWDGWDSRTKTYLSNAGSHLPLRGVVESYFELVQRFYLWLGQRMMEIHADAFTEYSKLQEHYQALRQK